VIKVCTEPTAIVGVRGAAVAVAVTVSSATVSVCQACLAPLATSRVPPGPGAQTASICVTVPHSNTLPAAIQRFEYACCLLKCHESLTLSVLLV